MNFREKFNKTVDAAKNAALDLGRKAEAFVDKSINTISKGISKKVAQALDWAGETAPSPVAVAQTIDGRLHTVQMTATTPDIFGKSVAEIFEKSQQKDDKVPAKVEPQDTAEDSNSALKDVNNYVRSVDAEYYADRDARRNTPIMEKMSAWGSYLKTSVLEILAPNSVVMKDAYERFGLPETAKASENSNTGNTKPASKTTLRMGSGTASPSPSPDQDPKKPDDDKDDEDFADDLSVRRVQRPEQRKPGKGIVYNFNRYRKEIRNAVLAMAAVAAGGYFIHNEFYSGKAKQYAQPAVSTASTEPVASASAEPVTSAEPVSSAAPVASAEPVTSAAPVAAAEPEKVKTPTKYVPGHQQAKVSELPSKERQPVVTEKEEPKVVATVEPAKKPAVKMVSLATGLQFANDMSHLMKGIEESEKRMDQLEGAPNPNSPARVILKKIDDKRTVYNTHLACLPGAVDAQPGSPAFTAATKNLNIKACDAEHTYNLETQGKLLEKAQEAQAASMARERSVTQNYLARQSSAFETRYSSLMLNLNQIDDMGKRAQLRSRLENMKKAADQVLSESPALDGEPKNMQLSSRYIRMKAIDEVTRRIEGEINGELQMQQIRSAEKYRTALAKSQARSF